MNDKCDSCNKQKDVIITQDDELLCKECFDKKQKEFIDSLWRTD